MFLVQQVGTNEYQFHAKIENLTVNLSTPNKLVYISLISISYIKKQK